MAPLPHKWTGARPLPGEVYAPWFVADRLWQVPRAALAQPDRALRARPQPIP